MIDNINRNEHHMLYTESDYMATAPTQIQIDEELKNKR